LNRTIKHIGLLIGVLCSFLTLAKSGDTLLISQLNSEGYYDLRAHQEVYQTDTVLSPMAFLQNRGVLSQAKEGYSQQYWYELRLLNDLPDTQYCYVSLSWSLQIHALYQYNGNYIMDTLQAGYLTSMDDRSLEASPDFIKLTLPPGEYHRYLGLSYSRTNHQASLYFSVYSHITFLEFMQQRRQRGLIHVSLSIFFQGAVWIMMLYMLFLYFQNNRDKVYLSYAAYLFFAMLYLGLKLESYLPLRSVFGDAQYLKLTLNEPLQFAMALSYNVFALHFLRIRKLKPWLYRLVFWVNVGYAVYGTLVFAYLYTTSDMATIQALFAPTRGVMLLMGLVLICVAGLTLKSPVVPYFIAGSLSFLIGNLLAIVSTVGYDFFPGLDLVGVSFTQIGIFVEILFFSLGIGKLIQISNREKEDINDAYIEQLLENEKLNQQINQELEQQVEARTNEVLRAHRELEESKASQIRSEYEKQLMESEMNSLRLQMNPHFIFNSLNSIRYFILKEDGDKAADYITSFAKLLRMILHHSKQKEIALEDELEALELYMMFEAERFSEKFNYEVIVEPDVDTRTIMVQPLIIQPFVENAIWHGLMHRKEAGRLIIKVSKLNSGEIRFIIEDNGVGRAKAAELKSKKHGGNKSYGLQITRSRLEAANRVNKGQAGFTVEDLYDSEGKPVGTRVILIVNIRQHESTYN